jgi:short-subunit dehydrogenase
VAGRVARSGSGVYSLTKHGVGAFSESLRQELATRYVRVCLVEPGATATELAGASERTRRRLYVTVAPGMVALQALVASVISSADCGGVRGGRAG